MTVHYQLPELMNTPQDGINLAAYNWTSAALREIADVRENHVPIPGLSNATKIDTHGSCL